MRSTVSASDFAEAIKKVSSAIRSAPVISELGQVRVDFDGDTCRLSASDLTVWMSAEIAAAGDSFSFLLNDTKTVTKASKHFTGNLSFESLGDEKGMRVRMYCADREGEFAVHDSKLCPEYPHMECEQRYAINAEQLYRRVDNISYATRITDSKPVLSGVRFQGNTVWCVDGYRMAVSEADDLSVEKPFILPADALHHLRLFGDRVVELSVGQKYAEFAADGLKLCCRLLMPEDALRIQDAIPQKSRETYSVDRKQYKDALRYLRECCSDRKEPVLFNRGKLMLEHRNAKYSAQIDVRGECDIRYAFDPAYMRDALEQFDGADHISIGVSSENGPIILSAGGTDTALLLPVRMRSEWQNAA